MSGILIMQQENLWDSTPQVFCLPECVEQNLKLKTGPRNYHMTNYTESKSMGNVKGKQGIIKDNKMRCL